MDTGKRRLSYGYWVLHRGGAVAHIYIWFEEHADQVRREICVTWEYLPLETTRI